MDKYLFYKMTHDSGFAPNPFGEHLTLAACTPNHTRGCSLKEGGYIIGVESDEGAKSEIIDYIQKMDILL